MEEELVLNEVVVETGNEWPYVNAVGNCWCGHTFVEHATIHVVGGPECSQCQCVGYVEDKWGNSNGL